MRLITRDDLIESYCKIHQRGLGYILSKFGSNPIERTKSTFNTEHIDHANWWIIPAVRERWNRKVSGDPSLVYEDYVVRKYLSGRSSLKMLSLGSGVCSHEIKFAGHDCFAEVRCMDVADSLLKKAQGVAEKQGLRNMVFEVADVNSILLPDSHYDVVLFHASLHHFKNVEELVSEKVKKCLKPGGLLVMNDYVGPARLQWTSRQVKETNRILKEVVPEKYRKRFKTGLTKTSVSGPGVMRMLLTDPSEAVESDKILPSVRSNFEVLEEKAIGGNILTLLFKDISHNFLDDSRETKNLLEELFQLEDKFLETEESNTLFGVYQKK